MLLSRMKLALTATVLGTGLVLASGAQAAPAGASPGAPIDAARKIVGSGVPAEFTQYRRRGGYGRGFRGGRRYYGRGYGRRYYGRPYRYRRNRGAAIGAGIAGLAAGAILGGALAAQAQPAPVYGGNAVAYCSQRFKSYDPASGTYLGYDGIRHPCP